MSMPLCGLRGWPLNTRRRPKLLLRRPGTGWRMRRSPGREGASVNNAMIVCWWARSRW
jgi:hypothetical protein